MKRSKLLWRITLGTCHSSQRSQSYWCQMGLQDEKKFQRLDRKAQGKASYKRLYSKGRHRLWWCTCPCCLTGNYKINHFISSGRFFKWIWTLLFLIDSSKRKSTSDNHQTVVKWHKDKVIRLKKNLYGWKQAPRTFFFVFTTHFDSSPSITSKIHACNKQSYKVTKCVVKYF